MVLYVAGSVWAGAREVGATLAAFQWPLYVAVLALTGVNYLLRFVKWHMLLRRLGVNLPARDSLAIFVAGLSMVISPGKAGELVKPWLVTRRTGVSIATTTPALVAERLTDGIAMLALAFISIGTYASHQVMWLVVPAAVVVLGLGVLAWEGLSLAILGLLRRIPVISRVGDKLEEMYRASRVVFAPDMLAATMALSLAAWGAECVGFLLVFQGLGVEASLDAATFLYAFATVAGGAMPGGLGVSDGALAGGSVAILGVSEPVGVAAALLIRVATLWLGVLVGAVALLRFESLMGDAPVLAPAET